MNRLKLKEIMIPLSIVGMIILSTIGFPQTGNSQYSEVKIFFQDQTQLYQLAESGLIFDHAHRDKAPEQGFYLTTVLNTPELSLLQNSGLSYQILIEDVIAHFNSLPVLSIRERREILDNSPVAGFGFGSMGGFYTMDEILSELDSMRLLYPALISEKQSIGTSMEGRDIWMVKISDNPGLDENEPEILYNALHHAREPQGMMALIYYMYYLLENYGSNPEATYLVNEREMYFVPVVNPDGYEHNRQTNPNGGGMWRKNRRDNGNGSFGVDLNRNYGYQWGFDDDGSSPNPADETYRGTGAFSEPETQTIQNLFINREFNISLNYHTYSNLLIYPWGYIANSLTPDSTTFSQYASEMTRFNEYAFGTANQTVGYNANGVADDWMYGEQTTKNKVLAMTPEVGGWNDGFWPPQSRIFPLAEENLHPNLFVAWAAGGLAIYGGNTINDGGNQNGFADPGETVQIIFSIKNIGLGEAKGVIIRLISSDALITINDPGAVSVINLPPQGSAQTGPFSFTVDPATSSGYIPQMNVEVETGGVIRTFPISDLIIGTPFLALSDSAENGAVLWNTGNGWDTTSTAFYNGNHSFTDSPTGNYNNNVNNSLTLITPINLTGANSVFLEFWTKWDIESGYDFAQLQISTDGNFWTPVEGQFTVAGSGQGVQNWGEPGYEGTQSFWVKEFVNLSSYAGTPQLHIRFNIRSDFFVVRDGWYIDDVIVKVFKDVVVGLENPSAFPANPFLANNFPNPFNPTTEIRFRLPKTMNISLTIYNTLGQEVSELINKELSAGWHSLLWMGTDQQGTPVSSGIYFYILEAGKQKLVHKMLLYK